MVRILRRPIVVFRLTVRSNVAFDATSRAAVDGRWNIRGAPIISTSMSLCAAMLEALQRGNGRMPADMMSTPATIPAGCSIDSLDPTDLSGWDSECKEVAQDFAQRWVASGRTLALAVPSVVAPGEKHVLLNTRHSEFARLKIGIPTPVRWGAAVYNQERKDR